MLASSDVARLSELIVQVKSGTPVDDRRLQRLADQWIETNLRAKALREELRKLDEQNGR